MKKIKEIFCDSTIHVEEAKGNYEDNYKYCSKEKNFWEMGEPKKGGDI